MRFALLADNQDIVVVGENERLYNLSAWGRKAGTPGLPAFLWDDALVAAANKLLQIAQTGGAESFAVPADVRLAAPYPNPTRILCIGRNYADHAKELGNAVPDAPIVFVKAATCVVGPNDAIVVEDNVGRVDFEGELLVVLGKGGRHVPEADAMGLVAGYSVFNDVTARTMQKALQEKKQPWFVAKSLDTFGPMGPYFVTTDEVPDPHALRVVTRVNGEVKQDGTTDDMMHSIPALIAYLSGLFALHAGDVIATGTPAGVGPLVPGDVVEVEVEHVGTLRNPVVSG